MRAEKTHANCVSGSDVIPYVLLCKFVTKACSAFFWFLLASVPSKEMSGDKTRCSSFRVADATCEACSKLWNGFSLQNRECGQQ